MTLDISNSIAYDTAEYLYGIDDEVDNRDQLACRYVFRAVNSYAISDEAKRHIYNETCNNLGIRETLSYDEVHNDFYMYDVEYSRPAVLFACIVIVVMLVWGLF